MPGCAEPALLHAAAAKAFLSIGGFVHVSHAAGTADIALQPEPVHSEAAANQSSIDVQTSTNCIATDQLYQPS